MKLAGRIVFSAVSALLLGTVVGAVVATDKFGGVIDDYFDDSDFSFNGEEFKQASAQSDALCQSIAENGVALLRNEKNKDGKKTLPFDVSAGKKVNVFGWSSIDNGFLLSGIGSGSSTIRNESKVTLLDALHDAGWETNTELTAMYEAFDNTKYNFSTGNSGRTRLVEPAFDAAHYPDDLCERAEKFSQNAIVVISRVAGENVGEVSTKQSRKEYGSDPDRSYLHISRQEEDLLDYVTRFYKNVCVIINSSNTMELGFLEEYQVGACLNVGLMGQSGTRAIPKILEGLVNPSGRVTDTFAYDSQSAPSFVNYTNFTGGAGYFEGIYEGYRWYETADAEGVFNNIDNEYGRGYKGVVQYPFGYGLSYSSFEWRLTNVSLPDGSDLKGDSEVTLTFACTNTGDVAGKDVMQIYGHAPYTKGGIEKSEVVLLDFAKSAEIPAGQTQSDIKVSFSAYQLASYDCYDKNGNGKTGYELDAGDYEISFRENAHEMKKMEGDGANKISYRVASTINIDKDPTTGKEVTNQFTGDTAYADNPLDGSKALKNVTYLSRNDFASTMPKKIDGYKDGFNRNAANTYTNHSYDTNVMVATGVENNLRLTSTVDGKLVYNDELIEAIASDYDGEELEKLVSQLSAADGWLRIPRDCEGIARGEEVEITIYQTE